MKEYRHLVPVLRRRVIGRELEFVDKKDVPSYLENTYCSWVPILAEPCKIMPSKLSRYIRVYFLNGEQQSLGRLTVIDTIIAIIPYPNNWATIVKTDELTVRCFNSFNSAGRIRHQYDIVNMAFDQKSGMWLQATPEELSMIENNLISG